MTYGFRPENWPAFEHELRVRGILVSDIEKVEMRPHVSEGTDAPTAITVVLRSGRVASWVQQRDRPIE